MNMNFNEKVNILNIRKAVTHDGVFHADDVTAWVLVTILNPDAVLVRSRKKETFENADLVFDVGGEYFKYDHHKKNPEKRSNGIIYSSAGLLWRDFGALIVKHFAPELNEEEITLSVEKMDNDFFLSICSEDNGQRLYSSENRVITYSQVISDLNPADGTGDEEFQFAVEIGRRIFMKELNKVLSYVKEISGLKNKIAEKEDPEILIMGDVELNDSTLEALCDIDKDVLYVVFKGRDSYRIMAMPVKYGEFTNRKPLPSEWRGKRDGEFEAITGVKGAVFCHPGLFMAGADSLEGAIALAKMAVRD